MGAAGTGAGGSRRGETDTGWGKGRAGWARQRGRARRGEAGGGEPSAAVWGRAPLELFCQPPYLWAEYFRGGEGGDCWEGLEMMGLGRNHRPGGREGGMPGPGRNHRRGGVCARWRLLGVGRKCSRRTGEGGPVGSPELGGGSRAGSRGDYAVPGQRSRCRRRFPPARGQSGCGDPASVGRARASSVGYVNTGSSHSPEDIAFAPQLKLWGISGPNARKRCLLTLIV